jgi:hypothetical protein
VSAQEAEGVDGTVVAFRERVHAPLGVWLVVLALTGSIGVAYGYPLGLRAGLVTFAVAQGIATALLVATAPLLVIDDRVLRAGRARLPLRHVGRIVPLDRTRTSEVRGPKADPAAYLATRGWIPRSVLVEVDDDADPHPYWLVSTRHGDRLAPILAQARDRAKADPTTPRP